MSATCSGWQGHWYDLKVKLPPSPLCLNTWSPADATVSGSYGTFRMWDLDAESGSCGVELYHSLLPCGTLCFQVCATPYKKHPQVHACCHRLLKPSAMHWASVRKRKLVQWSLPAHSLSCNFTEPYFIFVNMQRSGWVSEYPVHLKLQQTNRLSNVHVLKYEPALTSSSGPSCVIKFKNKGRRVGAGGIAQW